MREVVRSPPNHSFARSIERMQTPTTSRSAARAQKRACSPRASARAGVDVGEPDQAIAVVVMGDAVNAGVEQCVDVGDRARVAPMQRDGTRARARRRGGHRRRAACWRPPSGRRRRGRRRRRTRRNSSAETCSSPLVIRSSYPSTQNGVGRQGARRGDEEIGVAARTQFRRAIHPIRERGSLLISTRRRRASAASTSRRSASRNASSAAARTAGRAAPRCRGARRAAARSRAPQARQNRAPATC